jgi:hypothetical protein
VRRSRRPKKKKKKRQPRQSQKQARVTRLNRRRVNYQAAIAQIDVLLRRDEQILSDYRADQRPHGRIKRLSEKYDLDRSTIHRILREGRASLNPPAKAPPMPSAVTPPPTAASASASAAEPVREHKVSVSHAVSHSDKMLIADIEAIQHDLLSGRNRSSLDGDKFDHEERVSVSRSLQAVILGIRRRQLPPASKRSKS